jgi:peroxiredoxin
MTDLVPLIPRQPVPDLAVELAGGGHWRLADRRPKSLSLVVFYRGRHCPQCQKQLADLNRKMDEFEKRGVDAIAISTDSRDRAEDAKAAWSLDRVPIGYDFSLQEARRWGLYISTSRGKTSTGFDEPALFSEPGIFLVRPDGTLFSSIVQTMPFVRLHFAELLPAIDSILEKDYPARGHIGDLSEALANAVA